MPELAIVALTISLAAGMICASYISFTACVVLAIIAALLICIIRRDWPRVTIFIIASIFILGAIRISIDQQIASNDISNYQRSVSAFEGVVSSDPEARSDKVSFVFRVDRALIDKQSMIASGNVMVNLYLDKDKQLPKIAYGDRASITATPYSPLEPTNPGQFSWSNYLARQEIHTCVSIRHSHQLKMLHVRQGNPVIAATLGVKHHLVKSIQRIYPKEEASVIAGMVLGTYSYLPSETFRNFTLSGTLHLLAASGYNCYLLLVFATLLLKYRLLPKWRNILVVFLIGAYLLIVGPKPSLVRASIMASLILLAMPFKRVANIRNIYFASAFIALMYNPSDLFDVGFQLSYLAVWALISVVPILESILSRTGLMGVGKVTKRSLLSRSLVKIAGITASAGISTVAVSLVTAPLVAYYFNYISLVSIPANIALAAGVPFIFIAGLASPLAAKIGYLGVILKWIGIIFTRFTLNIVNYFGSLSHSAVSVASPGIPAILGYYLLLYAVLKFVESKVVKR